MLTFTPDGSKVVVAIEGEPSDDNYAVDPEGQVAIIDVSSWNGSTLTPALSIVDFDDFSGTVPDELVLNGYNSPSLAQDVEPEYVAISADSRYAYVALQENNGLVVIDLDDEEIDQIYALGFKDHSVAGNEIDGFNKNPGDDPADGSAIKTEPGWGMYQPDSIATIEYNDTTYVLTANEGDDRSDWVKALSEENCEDGGFYWNLEDSECADDITLKDAYDTDVYDPAAGTHDGSGNAITVAMLSKFNTGGIYEDATQRLKFSYTATRTYGNTDESVDDSIDRLLSFGGRSFSIWNGETGALVYDSGSDFEDITFEKYGTDFNQSNDENAAQDRSDNKGPEPEALTVATINDKTYAFIGMERMGGIMVYDITNPTDPEHIEYVNNRNIDIDFSNNE